MKKAVFLFLLAIGLSFDIFCQDTTTAIPLPYYDDFTVCDSGAWVFNSNDAENRWQIGIPTAYNANGPALFVSNDGSGNYQFSGKSFITAIKTFYMPQSDSIIVDFDLTIGGDSWNGDYMKVMLSPVDSVYSTGGDHTNNLSWAGTRYGQYCSTYTNRFGNRYYYLNRNILEDSVKHVRLTLHNPRPLSRANLVFGWINDLTGGRNPGAIIRNLKVLPLTCPEPQAIRQVDRSQNYISLSWQSAENDFVVEYIPINSISWQNAIQNEVYDTNITLSDLLPMSSYLVRIKTICDSVNGQSLWSEPFEVSTSCEPYSLEHMPYNEDFEDTNYGSIPPCWYAWPTIVGNSYPSIHRVIDTNISDNSNRCLVLQSDTNRSSTISLINLEGHLNDYNISFYAKPTFCSKPYAGRVEIGYLENGGDSSSFVMIDSISAIEWQGQDNWKHIVVNYNTYDYIPDNSTIAIKHYQYKNQGNLYQFFLDNITIERDTICSYPSQVHLVSRQSDSVTFTWNNTTNANLSLYYKAMSDTLWQRIDNITLNSEGYYVLNNLTPLTNYQLYLVNNCNNYQVNSLDTIYFSTSATIASLPYNSSFVLSPPQRDYWVSENSNMTNGWYMGTPMDNNSAAAIFVSNDNGNNATYTINALSRSCIYRLIQMPANDSIIIDFDLIIGGESYYDFLKVFLCPLDTIHSIDSDYYWASRSYSNYAGVFDNDYFCNYMFGGLSFDSSGVAHCRVVMANPCPNQVGKLVFGWVNDQGMGRQPSAIIRNIHIEPQPCYGIVNLNSHCPNSNSCLLSWQENPNVSTWQIEYQIDSLLLWDDDSNIITIEGNNYLLDSLSPNTMYRFRIRAICDSVTHGVWKEISFLTPCAAITNNELPYIEDFEQYTDISQCVIPLCWQRLRTYYATPMAYPYINTGAHNSIRGLYFFGTNRPAVILPSFSQSLSTLSCSFWLKPAANNTNNESFEVGIISSNDSNTYRRVFVIQATDYLNTAYKKLTVRFDDINISPDSNYNIVLQANTVRYGTAWFVDDICVDIASPCPEPYDFRVISSDEHSVSFSWQERENESYNLYYKPIDSNNWTSVPCTLNQDGVFVLNGLNPCTRYDFTIATICHQPENIFAYDTIRYSTKAIALDIPFYTDFANNYNNNWSINNDNCINKWQLGVPIGEDSTCLFVTNNDSTATYSHTTNNTITAIKPFNMPTNEWIAFHITMKVGGNSNGNFIKIFLDTNTVSYNSGNFVPNWAANTYASHCLPIGNISSPYYLADTYNNYVTCEGIVSNPNPGGVANLVIMWTNNSSNIINNLSAIVKNISLEPLTCPLVSNIMISAIDTNEIRLSWQSDTMVNAWDIQYKNIDSAWSEANILPAYQNNYILSGLTPATTYAFRVRSNCNEHVSPWSDTIQATTQCAPIVVSEDNIYTEYFENSLYPCWYSTKHINTEQWILRQAIFVDGVISPYLGDNMLYCQHNSDYDNDTIFSPIFDITALENPAISFVHIQPQWSGDQDSLKVICRNSDNSPWVELATYCENITTWQRDTLLLISPSSNYQIAFVRLDGYGYGVAIDAIKIYHNVIITPPENHPTVSTLPPSAIGQHSATINASINGDSPMVFSRGFAYKMSNNHIYTIVTANDNNTNNFNYDLDSLTSESLYLYKAFITVENDTIWGEELNFTTLGPCNTTYLDTNIIICQGENYQFGDLILTQSGSYTYIFEDQLGCDSVVNLTLTIDSIYQIYLEDTINSTTPYEFNGNIYTQPGVYIDSLLSVNGCDSIIILTLNLVSLQEIDPDIQMFLYPNPTNKNTTLIVKGLHGIGQLILSDQQGKEIIKQQLFSTDSKTIINTKQLPSGIYYLRIISNGMIKTEKLIKL